MEFKKNLKYYIGIPVIWALGYFWFQLYNGKIDLYNNLTTPDKSEENWDPEAWSKLSTDDERPVPSTKKNKWWKNEKKSSTKKTSDDPKPVDIYKDIDQYKLKASIEDTKIDLGRKLILAQKKKIADIYDTTLTSDRAVANKNKMVEVIYDDIEDITSPAWAWATEVVSHYKSLSVRDRKILRKNMYNLNMYNLNKTDKWGQSVSREDLLKDFALIDEDKTIYRIARMYLLSTEVI